MRVVGWRFLLQLNDLVTSLPSVKWQLLQHWRKWPGASISLSIRMSWWQCGAATVQAGAGPSKALGFLIMMAAWGLYSLGKAAEG